MCSNYEQLNTGGIDDFQNSLNMRKRSSSFHKIIKKNSLFKPLVITGSLIVLIFLGFYLNSKVKQLEKLRKANESLIKELELLENNGKGLQKEYDDLLKEKSENEKENDKLSKNIDNLKQRIENLQSESEDKNEVIDKLQKRLQEINEKISKVTKENSSMEKEISTLNKESEELQKEIEKMTEQIKKLEENMPVFPELKSKFKLSQEQVEKIVEWIDEGTNYTFKLLYQSPKDDFSAAEFHRKCDNKGSTLILLKINDNVIVGGYTTQNWEGKGYKEDNKAFVFNLNNEKKYPINEPEKAIYTESDSEYIMLFGYGDLFITEKECGSNFPQSYGGKDCLENELTNGLKSLVLYGIEVFEIVQN